MVGFIQPLDYTNDVERRRRDHVLEASVGKPKLAAVAQVADADPLREGAFHPGSHVVSRLEFDRSLVLAGRLEDVGLFLRTDRDMAGPVGELVHSARRGC